MDFLCTFSQIFAPFFAHFWWLKVKLNRSKLPLLKTSIPSGIEYFRCICLVKNFFLWKKYQMDFLRTFSQNLWPIFYVFLRFLMSNKCPVNFVLTKNRGKQTKSYFQQKFENYKTFRCQSIPQVTVYLHFWLFYGKNALNGLIPISLSPA